MTKAVAIIREHDKCKTLGPVYVRNTDCKRDSVLIASKNHGDNREKAGKISRSYPVRVFHGSSKYFFL